VFPVADFTDIRAIRYIRFYTKNPAKNSLRIPAQSDH